jgi:ATP-dependent DNA helicase RecG
MKETRTLELKSEITNTFLKTVSAFSNYDGGKIIFGVNDDGVVCGLPDPEQACLDIENKINDTIHPQPDYELSIQKEDKTVTLSVHPGMGKPYLYKSKAYRRNDTSTIEVDDVELTRLILEGKNINFEQLPADNQDLTFHALEDAAIREIGIKSLNQDILKTLNLYTMPRGYNRAAEILADENTFPGIDIARFGESVNVILKRETLEHRSILTELDQAVKIFRDYYSYEEIEGMERRRVERIPEEAFRETIANALIHRTWDVASSIRVYMFDDRIEVSSPGGLPSGISQEEYLNGSVSVLRNPIIGNVFYRLHIVEILGTGVLRIKMAYAKSNKKPAFEIHENSIKVTLPNTTLNDLSADEQMVLDSLGRNTLKPISEITAQLPFGKSKTSALLKSLIDKNYVAVSGRGRGTKYQRK